MNEIEVLQNQATSMDKIDTLITHMLQLSLCSHQEDQASSISSPHLSGIATLLKSSHPNWSPSAIKSAIMVTVDVVDSAENPVVDETLLPAGFKLHCGDFCTTRYRSECDT
ncbi:hypothetical protein FEM48_Zijuj11G0047400 [Ziziphus jujuba var. spinosa]|uniref:Peptidase S8/S53 domain-containing protein n=1 Tax=Ziziphus jujuba var. spinosa TaxID=714518 RepID=A0A978UGW9_ZIZJJ|nr:hypothetical protein FEM48_Zijuj11G0047400 [Ziziphus jujuba var. spinosa]